MGGGVLSHGESDGSRTLAPRATAARICLWRLHAEQLTSNRPLVAAAGRGAGGTARVDGPNPPAPANSQRLNLRLGALRFEGPVAADDLQRAHPERALPERAGDSPPTGSGRRHAILLECGHGGGCGERERLGAPLEASALEVFLRVHRSAAASLVQQAEVSPGELSLHVDSGHRAWRVLASLAPLIARLQALGKQAALLHARLFPWIPAHKARRAALASGSRTRTDPGAQFAPLRVAAVRLGELRVGGTLGRASKLRLARLLLSRSGEQWSLALPPFEREAVASIRLLRYQVVWHLGRALFHRSLVPILCAVFVGMLAAVWALVLALRGASG